MSLETMPSNGLAGTVKYWAGKIDMMTVPMPHDVGVVPSSAVILGTSKVTLAGGAQLGAFPANAAIPPKPDALNAVGGESKALWEFLGDDVKADPGGNIAVRLSLPDGTPPSEGTVEAELYYVLP